VDSIQLLMDPPEPFHQLLVFLNQSPVCILQVLQLGVKALLLPLDFHFAWIVSGWRLLVDE